MTTTRPRPRVTAPASRNQAQQPQASQELPEQQQPETAPTTRAAPTPKLPPAGAVHRTARPHAFAVDGLGRRVPRRML